MAEARILTARDATLSVRQPMPGTRQQAPDEGAPLDAAALWRYFAAGEKPSGQHLLGVEHEKLAVLPDGAAPSYEDHIEPLLERLAGHGWEPVREAGLLIGLRRGEGIARATVSLEPGGQTELSDAPRASARAAEAALRVHLDELRPLVGALGLTWLGLGFRPFGTLDDVPWMPKGRYRVMRAYLPTRGALAHEMMKRTATVQVNLDYASQADCATKLCAAMGTSSLVTALWAASPLVDGRATDEQSHRAACWLDTDPARCGLLDFVFADDAEEQLYRRYAEWALDVPMFFVAREGEYRPAHGLPFRRFLAEGFQGERATLADWELHLSTLFPEVRLKQYLEVRGADAGPLEMELALPALCRGLLYDEEARRAAWALVADWTLAEREALRREVPREGLRTRVRGQAIAGRCRELVAIAQAGLRRLGAEEDLPLLEPIERIARTERTVADELRELHRRAGGDPTRMIPALALR